MSRLFPLNEHTAERILRVLVGLGIVSLALAGPKTPWAFLGLIPVLTGLLGSCPLYTVLGIRTCPVRK